MGFLQRFGYLDTPTTNNSEALIREEAVIAALSRMQRFGGLEPTGRIDNDTLKVLWQIYIYNIKPYRSLILIIAAGNSSLRQQRC